MTPTQFTSSSSGFKNAWSSPATQNRIYYLNQPSLSKYWLNSLKKPVSITVRIPDDMVDGLIITDDSNAIFRDVIPRWEPEVQEWWEQQLALPFPPAPYRLKDGQFCVHIRDENTAIFFKMRWFGRPEEEDEPS